MTKYIISSRNYVLQCYQVWKWKLISISDNSKVELKSCLELLSVLNFIGNSIVAVNNSKQTDLDLCSDKSFRIQVKFPHFFKFQKVGSAKIGGEISTIQNYKVQWIIFFSVKRQQIGPWSIQRQLHWMSSLTQPCLVVIKRQDSSISTKDKGQRAKDKGIADLDPDQDPNLWLGNWDQ